MVLFFLLFDLLLTPEVSIDALLYIMLINDSVNMSK